MAMCAGWLAASRHLLQCIFNVCFLETRINALASSLKSEARQLP
jgi:hypothetical protein